MINMKIIKEIKTYPNGEVMTIETNKLIETPEEAAQFDKEMAEFHKGGKKDGQEK